MRSSPGRNRKYANGWNLFKSMKLPWRVKYLTLGATDFRVLGGCSGIYLPRGSMRNHAVFIKTNKYPVNIEE